MTYSHLLIYISENIQGYELISSIFRKYTFRHPSKRLSNKTIKFIDNFYGQILGTDCDNAWRMSGGTFLLSRYILLFGHMMFY